MSHSIVSVVRVACLVCLVVVPRAGARTPPRKLPDVKYVATPVEVVDRMLRIAQVTKKDVVYDLGCGDGRIIVAAAYRFGARGVGFDVDPDRVRESRARALAYGVQDRVTIKEADLFKQDLREATVITLYLLPRLNVQLLPQLKKLRPGTRILSHAFDIDGIRPHRVYTVRCRDGLERKIYVYITPLQKVK